MKEYRLEDKDGSVLIEEINNEKRNVRTFLNKGVFSPNSECETKYPIDLIKKIFEIKGSAWTCNEIMRDENDDYISNNLI